MLVHPFLDVDGPLAMAHRGFSLTGLENTMTAFAAAVDLGMTHVETDVHATRDGVVVAFHDSELDRVSDGRGAIADMAWADLRSIRVGGAEVVPTLMELLSSWPDLRVNIDVKDWPAVTPLADVLAGSGVLDRVCVASFDDRRSRAVQQLLGPGLATSLGRRAVLRWWLAATSSLGPRLTRVPPGAVAVQVPVGAGPLPLVTRRSIGLAHDLGLAVHVWTINTADAMHRLLDLGVDGLISDRSDTLREVLTARGQHTA